MSAHNFSTGCLLLAAVFSCFQMPARCQEHVVAWGGGFGAEPIGLTGGGVRYLEDDKTSETPRFIQVTGGFMHAAGLKSDGKVVMWGRFGAIKAKPLVGLCDIVVISSGDDYCMGVRKSGQVVAWGENEYGTLEIPNSATNLISISAGTMHVLGLRSDGTVAAWGREGRILPSGLTNVIAVAAGSGKAPGSLALTKEGRVIAWGTASLPSPITNAIGISAGEHHFLALLKDGTVYGWGKNAFGQATGSRETNASGRGQGIVTVEGRLVTNVVAVAASTSHGMVGANSSFSLALKADGSVVTWGFCGSQPMVAPTNVAGVIAIGAGNGFCIAATTNSPHLE